RRGAAAFALMLATALVPGLVSTPAAQAAGEQTVVSLTWDDGYDHQAPAAAVMNAHGMAGTFFVNSGNIGDPGFLTKAQLDSLAANGHEIGGHSLNHYDLTTLPAAEAK